MSLSALAVTPADAAETSPRLARIEAAGLAMVLSQAPLEGAELLSALGAIMRAGPALPLGRRARFDTAEAAHAWLAARAEQLKPAIAQIGGRVELVLSLSAPAAAAPAGNETGQSYLRGRAALIAEQERRESRLRELAEAIVDGLGEARRVTAFKDGDRIGIDACVLTPEKEAQALRHKIANRAQERLDAFVSARLAGPWPPVTFAALAFAGAA